MPVAPSIIAQRVGSLPVSLSLPAGIATAAWKNTQTVIIQ